MTSSRQIVKFLARTVVLKSFRNSQFLLNHQQVRPDFGNSRKSKVAVTARKRGKVLP